METFALNFWIVAASLFAAGQAAEGPPDPAENAALQYLKAFHFEETYGEKVEGVALHELLRKAREGVFTEKTEEILDRAEPYLEKMSFGASLPYCDWGLLRWPLHSSDISHLIQGKSLVNLAAARTRHLARSERGAEAVELLEGALVFCQHLSSGRLQIELVVQASCQSILIEAMAAELPKLAKEEMERLGTVLDARFLTNAPKPAAVFSKDFLFAFDHLSAEVREAEEEALDYESLNALLKEAGSAARDLPPARISSRCLPDRKNKWSGSRHCCKKRPPGSWRKPRRIMKQRTRWRGEWHPMPPPLP